MCSCAVVAQCPPGSAAIHLPGPGWMFGLRTFSLARRCLLGAAGRRQPAFPDVSSSNMVSVSISTYPTSASFGSDNPFEPRWSSTLAPPLRSDFFVVKDRWPCRPTSLWLWHHLFEPSKFNNHIFHVFSRCCFAKTLKQQLFMRY